MKKRRQHHVWQHYLKSWTVDGQLYCLRDGTIFPTGTNSVAVDRDFYKLHRLTDDDLALIKLLAIDAGHPLAKRHHEDLLVRLAGPARFVEENRHRLANLEKIEELLDVHQTNALEDYHAGVENRFLPLLDMILAGDLSFYEGDAQCITFLHFISMQTMRTKGVKERTIDRVKLHDGKDLTRIWDIMSAMFAFNIGMSLFLERKQRKLILLDKQYGRALYHRRSTHHQYERRWLTAFDRTLLLLSGFSPLGSSAPGSQRAACLLVREPDRGAGCRFESGNASSQSQPALWADQGVVASGEWLTYRGPVKALRPFELIGPNFGQGLSRSLRATERSCPCCAFRYGLQQLSA